MTETDVVQPAETPRDARAGDAPLGFWPWVGVGVGAAAVGVGVVVGINAETTHDRAVEAPSQRDAFERQEDAERQARIANIVWISGAAVASIGIVGVIINLTGSSTSTERTSTSVHLGIGTIGVTGRF